MKLITDVFLGKLCKAKRVCAKSRLELNSTTFSRRKNTSFERLKRPFASKSR